MDKKKFPVLIAFYHRPGNVKKLVDSLRLEKPEDIYVSSDGPKIDEHLSLVNACRDEIEKIDWPCTVHKLYRMTNVGMYVAIPEAIDFALSKHDGLVTFEDDCIPHEGFFDYLRYIDEIHKNDDQVSIYCGHNPIGRTPMIRKDAPPYSLSVRARVWGHYVKRGFWEEYSSAHIELPMSLATCLKESLRYPGLFSKLIKFRMLVVLRHKIGRGDITLNYYLGKTDRLVSIPRETLVTNIGDGESAAHTKNLPNIRFQSTGKVTYDTSSQKRAKRLNRVDVLDGWLLALWWLKINVFQRKQ